MTPRDPRISDIFYYFEKHTTFASGRTVGRKIGVVQEIILRRYLEQSETLRRRMYLEQSLTGRSGASHKVEFSWYSMSSVEVCVGDQIPGSDGLRVSKIDHTKRRISVISGGGVSGKSARSAARRVGYYANFSKTARSTYDFGRLKMAEQRSTSLTNLVCLHRSRASESELSVSREATSSERAFRRSRRRSRLHLWRSISIWHSTARSSHSRPMRGRKTWSAS